MRVYLKFATCSLACVFLNGTVEAASKNSSASIGTNAESGSSTNPYASIVERNVFGLRDPPSPLPPQAAPGAPPPRIILTGITTILGKKLAVLRTLAPAPKTGGPAKEEPLLLAEGERLGSIELLAVDERAGRVTLNDFGTVTNVSFGKEVPPAGPAPAATQGNSAGSIPAATTTQPLLLPAAANPATRSLPTRTPRMPVVNAGTQPGAAISLGAPGSVAAAPPAAVPAQPQAATQAIPLSPAEQAILQQLEQEQEPNGPYYQAQPVPGTGPPATLVPQAGPLPAPPRVPLAPQ